jgi:HD-GYP domain-containing protein (c-di-GMP phosphodiesterase class II)
VLLTSDPALLAYGMKPLLIVSDAPRLREITPPGVTRDMEVRHVAALPRARELDPARPTVILVDEGLLAAAEHAEAALQELSERVALVGVGLGSQARPWGDATADPFVSAVTNDATATELTTHLQRALRHAASLVSARTASAQEARSRWDLTELTRVGVALSTERNLLTLLELILSQARRLTTSDAGSLYLTERGADGGTPDTLRFKLSQNFSIPGLPLAEHTVRIDHASLAGYAAATGQPLVIEDVYLLPEDATYKQNRSFDDRFGYRTKSMLVIPMKTHRDEIVGVLQLINRKRSPDTILSSTDIAEREVVAFAARDAEVVEALASQAAVAIENSLLYEDIERLFEGFVTAAVTAIESRDPTTSGHSGRVATLTVGLAEAVDRGGHGTYKQLQFSREQLRELRYAGLLHDFGKVGVREQVLVKQKKLYTADLEIIKHRFAYLLQGADLQFERERANYLAMHGPRGYDEYAQRLDHIRRAKREELLGFLDAIVNANEPTILPEGSFGELRQINARTYTDFDGVERSLLRDDELQFLMIRKGNLDEQERREIESHVTHTYRFLEQIPWTRELRGIPAIAFGHHEKLNGRGYPRAVTADAIPVQTRMMTISDIYDALTATDRPYKRAVPAERALDILGDEAREGMLDKDLLQTFIEAGVFRSVGAGAE